MPKAGDPPDDITAPVYIDVCGVRNPSTKGRNVRYRLAASPGWECVFTIIFDKTVVARHQMISAINDAAVLVGIGDGRSIGNGRFEVINIGELTSAQEEAPEGSVEVDQEEDMGEGWEEVSALPDGSKAE